MTQNRIVRLLVIVVLLIAPLAISPLHGQQWTPLGPDGGDVRTLTRDPHSSDRILLTTSAGMIYESLNGGASWARFAKIGDGSDYVLDSVIFHPKRPGLIYVGAWSVENSGGDVFRSADDGRTWKRLPEMKGKSVRALAMSASHPRILVAGALDGVYRSNDGGDHWSLITPPGHPDLHSFESIAIDPVDPEVVYAGTWHLPWKTSDGGTTWQNIKNGIIDDSDVFSIIIDPASPNVVFASACSGIYKSENAGGQFKKVQGMPYSARRTRVLMQDPSDANVVYAGTTEGLWKTVDGGKQWSRMTAPNIIVNDVLVDPARPQRVMLATDRGGVLASNDGAQTFTASNRGFTHRQVAALIADSGDNQTLYAGLINDKEFGGVFLSRDAGLTWQQMSAGLNGLDVFSLRQSADGALFAGTNKGIFTYRATAGDYRWKLLEALAPASASAAAKPAAVRPIADSRVFDLDINGAKWFAATASGLYSSSDHGRSWQTALRAGEVISVKSEQQMVAAASRRVLWISGDGGASFHAAKLPVNITSVAGAALDPQSSIYVATREGAYRSSDAGETWDYLRTLPVNNVSSISYDGEGQRLLATSLTSTDVFESSDSGKSWRRSDAGWNLRMVQPVGGRIVAITAFDGIVAQPSRTTSAAAKSGGGNQ